MSDKKIRTTTLTPPDQLVWATRTAFTAPMPPTDCAAALMNYPSANTVEAATLKMQVRQADDGHHFALIRHLRVGDVWCVGTLTPASDDGTTHVAAVAGIDGALVIFIVFVNLLFLLWIYLAGAALVWYVAVLLVFIGLPMAAVWRDKHYLMGIVRGQLT